MLLSTYTAPPPPKNSNPLMIVLGVCGGGCVLVIIAVVVLGFFAYQKSKGLINGTIAMTQNMPKFANDLKGHDYTSAAALVDPDAQSTLNADAIRSIEEGIESKLGPMKSVGAAVSGSNTKNNRGTSGQPQSLEFQYQYPFTYEKGTATAFFTFRTNDPLKLSGLISDFKIVPDSGSNGK